MTLCWTVWSDAHTTVQHGARPRARQNGDDEDNNLVYFLDGDDNDAPPRQLHNQGSGEHMIC